MQAEDTDLEAIFVEASGIIELEAACIEKV